MFIANILCVCVCFFLHAHLAGILVVIERRIEKIQRRVILVLRHVLQEVLQPHLDTVTVVVLSDLEPGVPQLGLQERTEWTVGSECSRLHMKFDDCDTHK